MPHPLLSFLSVNIWILACTFTEVNEKEKLQLGEFFSNTTGPPVREFLVVITVMTEMPDKDSSKVGDLSWHMVSGGLESMIMGEWFSPWWWEQVVENAHDGPGSRESRLKQWVSLTFKLLPLSPLLPAPEPSKECHQLESMLSNMNPWGHFRLKPHQCTRRPLWRWP